MRKAIGDGLEELVDAATAVGLGVEVGSPDPGVDLVLVNPAGGRFAVEVKRTSLVSTDGLERRLERWLAQSHPHSTLRIVVADRVTAEARQALGIAGWSWLDLRGHLHIAGEGIFVDAEVPQLTEPSSQSSPLAGRVSREVAALLLLDPVHPAPVREVSRTLGRAPSSVSEAMKRMQDAGLVDGHRKPVIPDLFWQLAERWQAVPNDVRTYPAPGVVRATDEALRLGMNNVAETTGWALTDTMAAAAYGAPIGVRSDHPPDFYLPDQTSMRRALHLLGMASSHESRAATVRVAPSALVCTRRIDWGNETWPLARPLFVALDLARDPGRGREVLTDWTPPTEAGQRVW